MKTLPEVGDVRVATSRDHPLAVAQRTIGVAVSLMDIPEVLFDKLLSATAGVDVSIAELAAKHASSAGYDLYVAALSALGVPLTPLAEMVYLASRTWYLTQTYEGDDVLPQIRARMAELLVPDPWMLSRTFRLELDDEAGELDLYALVDTGLLGPEMEAFADNALLRDAVTHHTVPRYFAQVHLLSDGAEFAIRNAHLGPMLDALRASPNWQALPTILGAAASIDDMDDNRALLDRIDAGLASGELQIADTTDFASVDAFTSHIERFLGSPMRDIAFLQSRLETLARLAGFEKSDDDVLGVPKRLFWGCLIQASAFRIPERRSTGTVDTAAPLEWTALMRIAVDSGVRRHTPTCVPGLDLDVEFGKALAAHAGQSAANVFFALEAHAVMSERLRATTDQSSNRPAPPRQRRRATL